jgi:hypothetical protein
MWIGLIFATLVHAVPCALTVYSLYKSIQYVRKGLLQSLPGRLNSNRFKAFEMHALYILLFDLYVIGMAYIGGQSGGSVRGSLLELLRFAEPWCPSSLYVQQFQDYWECYVGTTLWFFMIYGGIPVFILNIILFGISIFRARHDNGPNGADPGFLKWPIFYWLLSVMMFFGLPILR